MATKPKAKEPVKELIMPDGEKIDIESLGDFEAVDTAVPFSRISEIRIRMPNGHLAMLRQSFVTPGEFQLFELPE